MPGHRPERGGISFKYDDEELLREAPHDPAVGSELIQIRRRASHGAGTLTQERFVTVQPGLLTYPGQSLASWPARW